MKMPTKVLWITLTVAVVVSALAWVGTFVYWHLRITSALQVMEAKLPQQMFTSLSWPSDLLEAEQILNAAGCRALPYFVRAAEPAKNPRVLEYFTTSVIGRVAHAPPNGEPNYELSRSLTERFAVDDDDALPVRRQKCDRLQAWWSENGSRHHQGWRIWSARCSE